ncbi:uncharacterized protein [Nicotiana sylvestris]|uniref:uncharacterized protein n=1 Tax=Nicotiana sylvestris TaxID=4096 RepID=UPI00388C4177
MALVLLRKPKGALGWTWFPLSKVKLTNSLKLDLFAKLNINMGLKYNPYKEEEWTDSELMINATSGYEAIPFMDGSSGYNQICMAPNDEELTTFRTPRVFIATRMNPLKCTFGVTSRMFLHFIVRHRGIEIGQAKVDAILKMSKPRDIHELKSLQGKLAYLRRFISNQAERYQPFSYFMKKGVPFKWDQSCSNAFESIKTYFMKPQVLAAPTPGKPLILYILA